MKHRKPGKPGGAEQRPQSNRQQGARPQSGGKPQGGGKQSPLTPQSYIVEGQSSVLEYVRFRPDSVLEIFATPQASQPLVHELRALKFPPRVADIALLKDAERVSSPVAATVRLKALELPSFEKRIADRTSDLILVLDHIEDPRNLGAIARSAGFFGVKEIIVPERRQVFLTQSAVATAQGGFAVCDLVCVPNLVRYVEKLKKENGYWLIGADMQGEHFAKLAGEYQKVLLVLGSEGSGMSRMMREACDRVAMIPGKADALESLNVSVAAGILLSAFSGSLAGA
jgi:23S rRNA (guanosine2251-2'-O)-methyltransferase